MSIKLFFNCLQAVPLATLLLLMALAHSAARAQGYYQSAITAAGPTSYWRLNESSGPTAVNFGSLGAAANGTYMGSPTYGLAGPNPAGGFEGFATTNSSVAFPTGSYIAIPNSILPTGYNPRSYELWFNADAGPTNAQTAFSHGVNTLPSGQRINISAANNAVAIAVNGHNYGKSGLALTGWNHLVVTLPSSPNANLPVTSNEFQFYLNGQALTGLTNLAGSAQNVNTQNAVGSIGTDSTGASPGSYLGNLDEVAVYNGALTAGQIAHHYNAALGLEQTTTVGLSDYQTVSKSGQSPATGGAFAGPLYVRERAVADNAALEVQAFIKFDLTGIAGDITNATLVLPETNKLNNVNSADIFGAQVLEDWNSLSLAPVFGDGLTDGTDVTGEFFIGNNGAPGAGPAVNINHYFDLTTLVQMWIDDPSTNFGLRLRLNDQNAGAVFDANSVRLLIGTMVPEPRSDTTWLLIVGLCAGAWHLWRRRNHSRETDLHPSLNTDNAPAKI